MSVTGTIAGALPQLAGSIAGDAHPTGVLTAGLPAITASVAGTVYPAGLMSGTLPRLVGVMTGRATVTGTMAASLPRIVGSMTGRATVTGTLSAALPRVSGAMAGGPAVHGTLSGALPQLIGSLGDGGRITGALPQLSGAITAYAGTAAAGRWLYLHTVPPAQVYATDEIRGRLRPWLPMHRARFEVSATAAQIGARNDSFSVSLSGVGSALRSRLATQAPYGVRVDVMDGGDVSRSGIVSGFGATTDGLDIDCESEWWTTDLPLRTNADLGTFRDVQRLPLRYGRAVPGKCIRLGASGKIWLWADHQSERITSVQVDDQNYGAWQWRNDVDSAGNPITVITTADAIDEGAQLVAVGDGMRDSLNGALIVNPADVVFDLCRRAGRAVDRGNLVPLRAECLARSLEISGTIDGGSLQSAMVTIADSIYAVFARELPGFVRLLPRSDPAVTIPARDTLTATAQRDSIATRLRVRFAIEDDQPRATLEVRALGVEALRGIASSDVTLPMIRDSRSAADVATRILADRARPAYVIPSAKQRDWIVPGDVVTATVTALGIAGDALVTASKLDEDGSTPTLSLRVGTAPTITIASVSAAYSPQQYTGATVATSGTDRVITITGTDGRPIAGARCTLDGSLIRQSDGAGRVTFPVAAMPAGPHTILVEATGMTPLTLTVVVQ